MDIQTDVAAPQPVAATKGSSNPYLLSSSDNPGSLISFVVLKEDNYPEAKKKKLGFIDGTTLKPEAEHERS